MLNSYRQEALKRQELNLPPLPLGPEQTEQITKLLEQGDKESAVLLELLETRVEPQQIGQG